MSGFVRQKQIDLCAEGLPYPAGLAHIFVEVFSTICRK